MFTNLIIFIAVIILYQFAPDSPDMLFADGKAWHIFYLAAVFFVITRLRFKNALRFLPRMSKSEGLARIDKIVVQQMMVAVLFYVACLFMTPFKVFLVSAPVLKWFPTLGALVALLFFLSHLVAIWYFSQPVYALLDQTGVSRTVYVKQQITLVLPLLLPWVFFSGVLDLLLTIPSEQWQSMLSSIPGQLVYFGIMAGLLILFGPMVILKFWGCTPVPDGHTRDRLVALCQKADFTCRQILKWPLFGGHMITAAVFGIASRFRFILMTDSMLRVATPDELDAVLAHEIGHAKKKHMLYFLLIIASMMPFCYLVWNFVNLGILYSFTRFLSPGQDMEAGVMIFQAIQGFFFVMFAVLYFRFVFGYFMRNFERQADLYVYEILPSAMPLVSMFKKIAWYSGRSGDEPNWHHFGINQRIQYILQCENDPHWIHVHNAKVKRSLIMLVTGLLVVLACLGTMERSNNYQRMQLYVTEKAMEARPPNSEQDSAFLGLVGDLHMADDNMAMAIESYHKALDAFPDNAHALNNLAWLYATSEDQEFYKPEQALELASRAVELDPSPHVLDTLAEAYFANGMVEQAVKLERQALEAGLGSPSESIYRENLKRFEDGLHGE